MCPRRLRFALLAGRLLAFLALALVVPGGAVLAQHPSSDFERPARGGDPRLDGFLGPQGYAILPLRRDLGPHLEVVARINGVPGHFLVDTGAQITVVDAASVAKFKLSAVKTGVRVYGAVGGPGEQIQAALAARLQIGPCEASPFLLGVSNLTALNQGRRERGRRHAGGEANRDAGQFDGIIGADVLQTFSFVIDCAALRLFAWPSGGREDHGAPPSSLGGYLRARGYGAIPMHRQSISDFEVSANVNGRKALWLVDTGAAITLLDKDLSRRAGIKLNPTGNTVGGAGGGRQRIDVGIVDSLHFSSVRVRSAVIAVSNVSMHNAALQDPGKPAIDGYLGADFLRERRAVIDCAQMQLYLRN